MPHSWQRRIMSVRPKTKSQQGQGLLEFSLIFMFLMFILMGIIGFSLIYNAHLNLDLAINSAARLAATTDYAIASLPAYYDEHIYDEIVDSLVLLSPDNIIDITIYNAADPAGPAGSQRDVLNKSGTQTLKNYPNSLRVMGGQIGVQVRYDQPVIVPLLTTITGEKIRIVKRASFRLE